jgi:cell division protein FtsQ
MSRVNQRLLLPPPLPDRPGRWRMIWRRQRRLLRPAVLLGVVMVLGAGFVTVAIAVGRAAPLREMVGRATAELGFRVQTIQVMGAQKTGEALVRKALGVSEGDSLLGFSLAEARKRIELLTWVQSATVERLLPDRIVVSLVERRPFAVWQRDGKFVLIDRDGEIVADQDVAVFAKELPLVVGIGADKAAAALIDALAAQPTLQSRVVAAVRVGERRWNLRLNNGTDVMLPEGAEVPAMARLVELQNEHALLDRPLQAVDLRLPDRLLVRPRGSDTPAGPPAPPAAKKPT